MIAIIYIIYITVILALFAYGGVLSTLRQFENNTLNEAFHIDINSLDIDIADKNIAKLLRNNEYIHSVWEILPSHKVIHYDNGPESIENDEFSKTIEQWEMSEDKNPWKYPFAFRDGLVLLPFVKKIADKGIVVITFPFYL